MAKYTKAERVEALTELRKLIKPGDDINCVLRHVSRSGMRREISLHLAKYDKPSDGCYMRTITWLVAKACGYSYNTQRETIKVDGCGMDMGFSVVYNLGRTLFPNGGPLEVSPRKRQEEQAGKTKEEDGGYLLKHRWL